MYLKQKSIDRKSATFDSYEMVKIYVVELCCLIDLMREDQTTPAQRLMYRDKAHSLLKHIPILVKNRQQHHFTIIELMVQFQEERAFTKLKDLDFISYKLFKLERAIATQKEHPTPYGQIDGGMPQLYLKEDEDEKKSPEEYCAEIQGHFSKIADSHHIKQIEYFMYGALCAYRNHHFAEAWNFIS